MAEAAAGASPDPRLEHPTAAALARVPGLEAGQRPLSVAALEGGTVNQLWRVDSPQGRFVVRIDGPQARRPGVDRAREFLLHERAAAAGLAPAIVAGDPASGVMVSHFIDGRRWVASDCSDRAALHRLGERLRQLHQLKAQVAPFDPSGIGHAYATSPAGIEVPHQAEVARLLNKISEAQVRMGDEPASRVIIHGDLNHLNVIESDKPWLIDWEYAQLADPLMDVGCLLAYYPEAEAHAGELLAATGLGGPSELSRLRVAVFIYRALSWLWFAARGERPPGKPPELR
jgi:aminoglycoside phosphotransferase (APT) family kinase protein